MTVLVLCKASDISIKRMPSVTCVGTADLQFRNCNQQPTCSGLSESIPSGADPHQSEFSSVNCAKDRLQYSEGPIGTIPTESRLISKAVWYHSPM